MRCTNVHPVKSGKIQHGAGIKNRHEDAFYRKKDGSFKKSSPFVDRCDETVNDKD